MVDFEILDDIALLRLNRPEVHNAINEAMMEQLERCLSQVETDSQIRSIIITGAGEQSFCAGGDLKYFATLRTSQQVRGMTRRMQKILHRLWNGDRVVIAAINGQALGGGCEILTACHFRVAASHATFAFRQAANGIITGWGGGWRLFKLLGRQKALWLLLCAQGIDSRQALRIGFVDQVVTKNELMSITVKLAQKICHNSREAIQAFLELARQFDEDDLERAREFEAKKFVELWRASDFQNFLRNF